MFKLYYKGSSWYDFAMYCLSSDRSWGQRNFSNYDRGFRIMLRRNG